MFEISLPSLAELNEWAEPELIDAMSQAIRYERAAMASKLIAAGQVCERRTAGFDDADRANWVIDDWERTAAEVGAALNIPGKRASVYMRYGMTLVRELPRFGAVCAAGLVDLAVIASVHLRTGLVLDDQIRAAIDEELARRAPKWNKMPREKIDERVDWIVIQHDPAAQRVVKAADRDRHVTIGSAFNGMVELWGKLRPLDAAALDRRLSELARTVCRNDPRTAVQRRADSVAALVAGQTSIACTCGAEHCAAANKGASPYNVVVNVVTDNGATSGGDGNFALVPGYGPIAPDVVAELQKTAKQRTVEIPRDASPEPNYRPSAALANFVRCRDLTCRFPGCAVPAEFADIDHTVPHPLGPTHAANLKLLCRTHHLLKTFFAGPNGWLDRQLADGTVVWTSPAGKTYVTEPGGAEFFPQLAAPTDGAPQVQTDRSVTKTRATMPLRRRTRAQDRAYRIRCERNANEARIAANPPPF